MAEYLVTSGSHRVTKDGTPLAGSPFASDVEAIQAAHDDGVTDDVIKLAQSGATKFEFGAAEQVLMSKGMPVEGVLDGRTVPTINGGKNAIQFEGVGENASFKNLKLENGLEIGLFVKKAADVTLEKVSVEVDTAQNRTSVGPSVSSFLGLLIGSNNTALGTPDGDITGNVSIKEYESNMEAGADESDPYAGERQKINPASIPEGGAWPGFGENPDSWKSFGAMIGYVRGRVSILDSKFVGQSAHGLVVADTLKEVELIGNLAKSWYGMHNHGIPLGGTGFMVINGLGDVSAGDEVFRARHGRWLLKNNEAEILGTDNAGFHAIVDAGGPFRPHSCIVQGNKVKVTGSRCFTGIVAYGLERGLISRNELEGLGIIGIYTGNSNPGITWATRNLLVLGNDVEKWTSLAPTYYSDFDLVAGVLDPAVSLDNVLDYSGNMATFL